MELGDDGLEHQAHARAARGVRAKVRPDHAKTEAAGDPMRPRGRSPTVAYARSARRRLRKRIASINRIRSDSSPTDS